MSSEHARREKPGGERGVSGAQRFKKFADQKQFLELFGCSTNGVRDLYKAAHDAILARVPENSSKHAPPARMVIRGTPAKVCHVVRRQNLEFRFKHGLVGFS